MARASPENPNNCFHLTCLRIPAWDHKLPVAPNVSASKTMPAKEEVRLRSGNRYRLNHLRTNGPYTAAILLIPLLLWSSLASAQAVGTVQTYAGDVKLERAALPVAITTGMGVMRGDRFTTGPNGRVVILLNEQSTLDLYESSVLFERQFWQIVRFYT